MNANEILSYVEDLKKYHKTNDPYKIAEYYGIVVNDHYKSALDSFTAHTIKSTALYPTMICINDKYTDFSKKLLCAHELGHALFHDGINHFATTNKNVTTNVEWEANLFAISLLDSSISNRLNMPLSAMNNYLLKDIIDYNLKFSE